MKTSGSMLSIIHIDSNNSFKKQLEEEIKTRLQNRLYRYHYFSSIDQMDEAGIEKYNVFIVRSNPENISYMNQQLKENKGKKRNYIVLDHTVSEKGKLHDIEGMEYLYLENDQDNRIIDNVISLLSDIEETPLKRLNYDILTSVLKLVPNYIFVVELQGNFLAVNKTGPDSTYEDILAKKIWEFVNPSFQDRLKSVLIDVKHMMKSQNIRIQSSFEKWYDLQIHPYDQEGQTIGYICIATSIEQEMELKNKNRRINEKYGKLLHYSPLPTYIYNLTENQIVEANQSFLDKLGYLRSELPYLDPYDFINLDKEQIDSKFIEITRNNYDSAARKWKTAQGDLLDVVTHWSKLEIEGSDYILVIAEDITESVNSQREKEVLEKKFEKMAKFETVGMMTSSIVHDFNNIFTIVEGYTDIILQQDIDSELERDIISVKKSLKRATDLSKQVLNFTKRSSDNLEEINFNELMNLVYPLIKHVLPVNITLKIDLPHFPTQIKVDITKIEHILLNLIVNAKDAMPEGGILSLSAKVQNLPVPSNHHSTASFLQIVVEDNGTGISEEDMEKIMDPLFTTKDFGTGLGLITVYNYVKQMEGHITIESEVGKGTRVDLYFPLIEQRINDPVEFTIQEKPSHPFDRVILIEENEELNRILKRIISDAGYEIQSYYNPSNILHFYQSLGTQDLLISELELPKMHGVNLYNQLIKKNRDLKVIFLSDHETEDNGLQHIEDLGCKILYKPFSGIEVLEAISRLEHT